MPRKVILGTGGGTGSWLTAIFFICTILAVRYAVAAPGTGNALVQSAPAAELCGGAGLDHCNIGKEGHHQPQVKM